MATCGVTGAGVVLDAASRGLRAALIERDDFASGTSLACARVPPPPCPCPRGRAWAYYATSAPRLRVGPPPLHSARHAH